MTTTKTTTKATTTKKVNNNNNDDDDAVNNNGYKSWDQSQSVKKKLGPDSFFHFITKVSWTLLSKLFVKLDFIWKGYDGIIDFDVLIEKRSYYVIMQKMANALERVQ